MKFDDLNIVAVIKFGSRLYGTERPDSDTDYVVIYVPTFESMFYGDAVSYKKKCNPDGSEAGPNSVMGAGCIEVEYVVLNDFVRRIVSGEVKSIEVLFGIVQDKSEYVSEHFKNYCKLVTDKVGCLKTGSMVGFAMKSTMDYVLRRERMDAVGAVIAALNIFPKTARLDTVVDGKKVIDHIKDQNFENVVFSQVPITSKSSRMVDAMELSGRQFMETTPLEFVLQSLNRIHKSFGARVQAVDRASGVEMKSFCHAFRTFQQAIELIKTGTITFPRPNRDELVRIRNGDIDVDVMLAELRELYNEYNAIQTNPSWFDDEIKKVFLEYAVRATEPDEFWHR